MSLILEHKITSGSSGSIYKLNDSQVAKVVPIPDGNICNPLELILYFTKSPYLMSGSGYTIDKNKYVVIMSKANYSLNKALKYHLKFNPQNIMLQIALGVKYLHDLYIIHGDIKPSNILIFKNKKSVNVKLTDFGLSYFCFNDRIYHNNAYTCGFKPPEIFTTQSYSFKSDIWALGQTFKIFEKYDIGNLDYLIGNMTCKNESDRWNIDMVVEFLSVQKLPNLHKKIIDYNFLFENLPILDYEEKVAFLNNIFRKSNSLYIKRMTDFESILSFFRNEIFV
jgi:serine/threonine protein kinase